MSTLGIRRTIGVSGGIPRTNNTSSNCGGPLSLFSMCLDTFRNNDGVIMPLDACAINDICNMASGASNKPSSGYTAKVLIEKGFVLSNTKDPNGWLSPIGKTKLMYPGSINPNDYNWSLTDQASKIFTKDVIDQHTIELRNRSNHVDIVVDSLYETLQALFESGPDGALAIYFLYLQSSGDSTRPLENSERLLFDSGLIQGYFVHEPLKDVVLSSIKLDGDGLELQSPYNGNKQTTQLNTTSN